MNTLPGQYALFPENTAHKVLTEPKLGPGPVQAVSETLSPEAIIGQQGLVIIEPETTGLEIWSKQETAPAHLLYLAQLAHGHSLARWAARYLAESVYGVQSPNTFEAKSRDLTSFIGWFVGVNGSGDLQHWLPRDTQAYLNHLEAQGRSAPTVNRAFATLRHMARWVNEQPGSVFAVTGLPTRGVHERVVDEPDCKKLSPREVHRLFKAADLLVLTQVGAKQRPRRNRAILALLYYTGLRVSELVQLTCNQYDGRYLKNVKRKGLARTKEMYVSADCRKLLDDYLSRERIQDASTEKGHGALFAVSGTDRHLNRRHVATLLDRIAAQASSHAGAETIHIHPHRLRHTFGAEYRQKTGSDTETAAALGHVGLGYVGRYVRKTQEEREKLLDEF
jgi:site-specific recombinase XerD